MANDKQMSDNELIAEFMGLNVTPYERVRVEIL